MFHGFNYTEQELTLTADASLFLYTDGVTEAENPDKQLFSEERLLKELDRLSDGTPTFIVNQMMEAIPCFVYIIYLNEYERNKD